ncbi:MAG: TetR/AcrR family transcriptional regulator [Fulvivirga sp.]|uniref:TetR/AcrR family transcriptional regulator n=1 Tax=Fulvivirga sp. TaxID=1931237 RepID=UPI0032F000A6
METTKEKIVKKSAELFNTYGYHACSLSHIMEATGLKKGGIYNHFKNKDEIAIEAFNYNYDRVRARFKERLGRVNTPTEKLVAVIDAFVSFIDDPIVQGGGCPIFNTAMDATNTHPMLKEKAKAGIEGLKKYVEWKLMEGIEAGEFSDRVEVKKVASLMVATLEGAIVMSRVEDNNDCLMMASDYLKEYLFKNIIKH